MKWEVHAPKVIATETIGVSGGLAQITELHEKRQFRFRVGHGTPFWHLSIDEARALRDALRKFDEACLLGGDE